MFGCRAATARKWYDKDRRTLEDVICAQDKGTKERYVYRVYQNYKVKGTLEDVVGAHNISLPKEQKRDTKIFLLRFCYLQCKSKGWAKFG